MRSPTTLSLPHRRRSRAERSLAGRVSVGALGLVVAATTLLVAAPLAAAEVADLPEPLIRYSFDDDLTAGVVENLGTGGDAFTGALVNAQHATAEPAPVATAGQSLKLPGGRQGTDQSTMPYVRIPNGVYQEASALTVSTWLKWDGANGGSIPWAFIVGGDRLPRDNWGTYFTPFENSRSTLAANSGTESKATGSSPLTTNQWTHITSVLDGSTLSYYINGSLVRTVNAPVDFSLLHNDASTFSGLIGRTQWTNPWAAYFGGAVDEFSVYREALSGAQVGELFAGYAGSLQSVETTAFDLTTKAGASPALPQSTMAQFDNGRFEVPVTWEAIDPNDFQIAGSTFEVMGTVPGTDIQVVARVSVEPKDTMPVAVDFSRTTGEFRGGATGTLYGLGDEGSPTQALVNGAWITNISQKPPFGTQHPGGDALNIEETFFDKHGEDLYIYTQDYYPDWPYNQAVRVGDDRTYTRDAEGALTGDSTASPNGVWDYLEVLELVVEEVATGAQDPERFLFIPFNEPDGIWYRGDDYVPYLIEGGQPDSYTPGGVSDWEAAHDVITSVYAKHSLDRPRIAGPGDSYWQGEGMVTRFLAAAVQSATVPDIYVWHELRGFAWMPDRMDAYRRGAQAAGLAPEDIPAVNITEYGAASEMSSPSNLLGWFASFEAAKTDAQTAYWTSSGTLSDNQARANAANAGWWLFNWYGDMHGSQTAAVTDGRARAIGAIDEANRRAQLIFGQISNDRDAAVSLSGLKPEIFGSSVDVEVREARVNGTDGLSGQPRVVYAADDLEVVNGSLKVTVPNYAWSSAYRLVVVPSSDRDVEADLTEQAAERVVEAEHTALDAGSYVRRPGGYRTSLDQDVAGFDNAASSSTWTVDIPEPGLYRLQVLGATLGVPVRHALFVDDRFDQEIQYTANAVKPGWVRSNARGTAEAFVHFAEAGEHALSLRGSTDGVTPLPNVDYALGSESGVSLDRYTLTRVGDQQSVDRNVYPASGFRLFGSAHLDHDGSAGTAARVEGEADRVDVYASTFESGYYDITVSHRTDGASDLALDVNGRRAADFTAQGSGLHESTARVHLPEGITELELRSQTGVDIVQVSTTRAVAGDESLITIEAEDATTVTYSGTAAPTPFGSGALDGAGTNGTGSGYVTGLGITDANPDNEGTMTVRRTGKLTAPGEYDVVVHFSNDDIEGTHDYNPQVVDQGLQVNEVTRGGQAVQSRLAGRTTFRYTYVKSSFFEQVLPMSLTGRGGKLVFGNTKETVYIDEGASPSTSDDVILDGYAMAPDVDRVTFAPLVLSTDTVTVPGQGQ